MENLFSMHRSRWVSPGCPSAGVNRLAYIIGIPVHIVVAALAGMIRAGWFVGKMIAVGSVDQEMMPSKTQVAINQRRKAKEDWIATSARLVTNVQIEPSTHRIACNHGQGPLSSRADATKRGKIQKVIMFSQAPNIHSLKLPSVMKTIYVMLVAGFCSSPHKPA
ncbi:MAG: hypothetical protein CM15mP78_08810 [Candidatus Poseidoniales archaeon]|nr:MAG: hypothetical protein CM15mP78_08810 [Candidatus Poseidoniales archaeon]